MIIETSIINPKEILKAQQRISNVISKTPLQLNLNLSEKYNCNVYLKREDLQSVRSFKIRGAYNKMSQLTQHEIKNGIVCASAGNHAQGVAFSCRHLKVKGKIFMPIPTPKQKIEKVKKFGKDWVEIILTGDSFDDAYEAAINESNKLNASFIHPFEDLEVIKGQGTIAAEIIDEFNEDIDYLLIAVGGGGLISGIGSYFKSIRPETQIISVESDGANALKKSLKQKQIVRLNKIDTFADGIAVKQIGKINFEICKEVVDHSLSVPEGKICSTILSLYNDDAIVAEPAGAVSIAALDQIKKEIQGKNVIIILCGGNNDIERTQEIKERSLLYEGKKHYFIIDFPQRAGALKEFLNVLGPNDDIAYFQYIKKSNKEKGPAVVGIELKDKSDYDTLITQMNNQSIKYQLLNNDPTLFDVLI